jgi:dipeptidyl aminopeptidase/acylaminoacyl peptidase
MLRSHRFLLLPAILVLAATAAADAPARRPMTVEDMWQVRRVSAPALSPDGRWAAVELVSYRMEENDSTSDLWLLGTDGKTKRQLTAHKSKESGPRWSPDGKQLAFLAKRDGDEAQIHLIAPDGGEARQLTRLPMSPSGLKWSADGKTLYCIAWTWPDTPDDDSYRKKQQAQKESKVKAYIIDDAMYRYWDRWIADGRRPVVFAVDAATGKHRNLFAGLKLHLPPFEPSAADYDVSPDGKEICFVADSTKDLGTDFNTDLYALSLEKPGVPRNLTPDNPAGDRSPVYSPDGKSITFTRQMIKFFYADRERLMVLDRASGKSRELTGNLDRSCGQPKWAPDSSRLYFVAEDRGYTRIYQVSVKGSDAAPLTAGFSDRSFDLSADGKQMVFVRSSFDLPAAVFAMTVGGEPRKIDTFNDELTARWQLGEVKEVWFKGADNRDVQMWVVYPPGFDAKKKWPLLQVVHGGPHNGITTDYHFRWNLQLFASRGYVVACINFHGSSGFGQEFTDSITGDLGTKPMIDILKGTDWMEAQPYIDRERTAAAGASYGGYMMAWLNGHTDRFKAMICHAGVYNWHSMLASDIVRSRERPLGALPWGDLGKIDRQTPQRLAANFRTPTLVIHGEKDFRVPVTQGFEYYNTLRLKGVPCRLIYFPDENHWVLSPQNSRLWHQEFFAWLEKYIGRGPTP